MIQGDTVGGGGSMGIEIGKRRSIFGQIYLCPGVKYGNYGWEYLAGRSVSF
jgi:hypothetical protein